LAGAARVDQQQIMIGEQLGERLGVDRRKLDRRIAGASWVRDHRAGRRRGLIPMPNEGIRDIDGPLIGMRPVQGHSYRPALSGRNWSALRNYRCLR
jgi:hypothetical protein